MFSMLRSLWQYRLFVINSIRNEFVSRFVRNKLGGLWAIINPLSQVAIYALILSNVLAAKLPGIDSQYAYAVYLMAGLLAWTLFTEVVSRCLTLFVEQGNLLKKMKFPRITLPAIVLGSSLLNNFFLFVAMLGVFAFLGHQFSPIILWLFPLTAIVVILAISLGLIVGVINVFIRDMGQMIPVVLQIWFWFTPIVYPINIIPEGSRHLLSLNPLYPLVTAYQQVLVYDVVPTISTRLIVVTAGSIMLLLFSLFLFRRASAEMVDVL